MKTAYRQASTAKRKFQADPSSAFRLINKLQAFTPQELVSIELPIRVAFESIRTGKGVEQDFHDIAAAINCAMVRSESVDPLCEQAAINARDALMRTWSRYERTGRMVFDGPAIGEVEIGIDLHEQFCRKSTPLQMIEAMREVLRRGESKQVMQ